MQWFVQVSRYRGRISHRELAQQRTLKHMIFPREQTPWSECYRLLQIASNRDPTGDGLPITGVKMSKDLHPTVPSLIQFQQDLKLNGKEKRIQQT
jgi:hypothetical protein